jgi:hypothetical protein
VGVGTPVTITITGTNEGGPAIGGDLQIAFPGMTDKNEIQTSSDITVLSRSSGETIGADYGQGQVTAQYVLIDANKGDWGSGETHDLIVSFIPRDVGTFRFQVKFLLLYGSNQWASDPSKGNGVLDQQREWAYEHSIDVVSATQRNGVLSGFVTSAITGVPIEGASISVSQTQATVSRPDGSYSIELPPGSYNVKASAAGCISASVSVQITEGQTTQQDFRLEPTQKIMTRIVLTTLTPDVAVQLTPVEVKIEGRLIREDTAAGIGSATVNVAGLPSGDVPLTTSADGLFSLGSDEIFQQAGPVTLTVSYSGDAGFASCSESRVITVIPQQKEFDIVPDLLIASLREHLVSINRAMVDVIAELAVAALVSYALDKLIERFPVTSMLKKVRDIVGKHIGPWARNLVSRLLDALKHNKGLEQIAEGLVTSAIQWLADIGTNFSKWAADAVATAASLKDVWDSAKAQLSNLRAHIMKWVDDAMYSEYEAIVGLMKDDFASLGNLKTTNVDAYNQIVSKWFDMFDRLENGAQSGLKWLKDWWGGNVQGWVQDLTNYKMGDVAGGLLSTAASVGLGILLGLFGVILEPLGIGMTIASTEGFMKPIYVPALQNALSELAQLGGAQFALSGNTQSRLITFLASKNAALAYALGLNWDAFVQLAQTIVSAFDAIGQFLMGFGAKALDSIVHAIIDPILTLVGVVVALFESGHDLHILVYDSQNRRVGYDPQTGQVVNEVPGATYFTSEGATYVTFPSSAGSFTYVIDGGQAQAQVETYDVAVATVVNGTTVAYEMAEDQTIRAKTVNEYSAKISGDQIEIVQVKKPEWTLIAAALLICATIGAVLYYDRRNPRFLRGIQSRLGIGRISPAGLNKCPSCGVQMRPTASFCKRCGTSLRLGAKPSISGRIVTGPLRAGGPIIPPLGMVCPNCRARNRPGVTHCTHCGRTLLLVTGTTQPRRKPAGVPLAPAGVVCGRCQASNRSKSRFCRRCGASLGRRASSVCTSCRATSRPRASYCRRCGIPLH